MRCIVIFQRRYSTTFSEWKIIKWKFWHTPQYAKSIYFSRSFFRVKLEWKNGNFLFSFMVIMRPQNVIGLDVRKIMHICTSFMWKNAQKKHSMRKSEELTKFRINVTRVLFCLCLKSHMCVFSNEKFKTQHNSLC